MKKEIDDLQDQIFHIGSQIISGAKVLGGNLPDSQIAALMDRKRELGSQLDILQLREEIPIAAELIKIDTTLTALADLERYVNKRTEATDTVFANYLRETLSARTKSKLVAGLRPNPSEVLLGQLVELLRSLPKRSSVLSDLICGMLQKSWKKVGIQPIVDMLDGGVVTDSRIILLTVIRKGCAAGDEIAVEAAARYEQDLVYGPEMRRLAQPGNR